MTDLSFTLDRLLLSFAEADDRDGLATAIAEGAELDACDADGQTALMKAVRRGHGHCVAILLEAGADINAVSVDDWSALMYAAYYGEVDCALQLLAGGADMAHQGIDGESALSLVGQCAIVDGAHEQQRFLAARAAYEQSQLQGTDPAKLRSGAVRL